MRSEARVFGYDGGMGDTGDNSDLRDEPQANEAVQGVVDRVLSWQEGAPADTVRAELEAGLREVGESMPDAWVQQTADRISSADPIQNRDSGGRHD
jgi:hypothetical protein